MLQQHASKHMLMPTSNNSHIVVTAVAQENSLLPHITSVAARLDDATAAASNRRWKGRQPASR